MAPEDIRSEFLEPVNEPSFGKRAFANVIKGLEKGRLPGLSG